MSQRRVVAPTVGLALFLGIVAAPAAAVDNTPKRCNFFCDVGRDFKSFATSGETAVVLGAGLGAALLAARFDDQIAHSRFNSELFENAHLGGVLEPGEVGGGAPVQFGLALGTFAVGKIAGNSTASQLGSALVRAQILSGTLTMTLKLAVGRERPDGSSNQSFPSGHTSGSFATATVLQRRFGWKVGAPAYALAGLVGASRLSENRHHLSDVVFGAAVGIAAGLSVGIAGGDSPIGVQPQFVRGGMGLSFTLSLR